MRRISNDPSEEARSRVKITRRDIPAQEFDGLSILDMTAGLPTSASLAEITVPPGAGHKRARSTRSDKYYLCLMGRVEFRLEGETKVNPGDLLIVPKGQWFEYVNDSDEEARLVLFHVPPFRIEDEEFADPEGGAGTPPSG